MLIDLVRSSRSFRNFNPERPISADELKELAELARLCPSSMNQQALQFVLASDPDAVQTILDHVHWAVKLKDMHLPHPGMEPPAFIVICQNLRIDPHERFSRDVGITAQTMLLGAVEKGLGGCMIGAFDRTALADALHLPPHLKVHLVVAIGEPAETVVLEELPEGGDIAYWRDEQDVHHVPKRSLEDLILLPASAQPSDPAPEDPE